MLWLYSLNLILTRKDVNRTSKTVFLTIFLFLFCFGLEM